MNETEKLNSRMNNRLAVTIGKFHIPTMLMCGGSMCIVSSRYPEMARMLCAKWSIAASLIILSYSMFAILEKKDMLANIENITRSFVLLGVIEVIVLLLQMLRVLPSFNQYFRYTGTFDNPAILAMVIALCMPICVFHVLKTTGKNRMSWYTLIVFFLLTLLVLESRTCIIAGLCASFIVICSEKNIFYYFKSNRRLNFVVVIGAVLLFTILYLYKRDSADGRILLWAVSLRMIAQKPLFGWGNDGIFSSFMPNQALFLHDYSNAHFSHLADNVSHPFNEFLSFGIKYGISGLFILLCLMFLFLKMTLSIKSLHHRSLYFGLLSVLLIISMFSYPCKIPVIWIISTFLVCSVISSYCICFVKVRKLAIILLTICFSWILIHNKHIYDEWKWQVLQISSMPVKEAHQKYNSLYIKLSNNPSFLYNYGAWLHHNGYYPESLKILSECKNRFDDYNVEMLMADNYKELGCPQKAINLFEYANSMVPSKFLPLYYEMVTYENEKDYANAYRIAEIIKSKPTKVAKSPSVKKIKNEAVLLMQKLNHLKRERHDK